MKRDMFGDVNKPIYTRDQALKIGGMRRTDRQYKKHNRFGKHTANTSLVGISIRRLHTNAFGCWREAGISLPWE
jgi:hypothetical protein